MSFGTSRAEIGEWFDTGKNGMRKRMIVWCDTFDYTDFPEYTDLTGDELKHYVYGKSDNYTKVMEVYDLTEDKAGQIGQPRTFNY